MTTDTLFDMASLTKVVSATTAAMILVRFATLWFAVIVGFIALSVMKRRHPGLLAKSDAKPAAST